MKIYLETTVLAALTYFRTVEKERYSSVSKLLEVCKKRGIVLIVSFYALHEIFLLAFDYFDKTAARKIGKHFVMKILSAEGVELTELLSREKRLLYHSKFKMKDRTDIPHGISAFVENCDYIITYDTHFDSISHLIKVLTPEEFISDLFESESSSKTGSKRN
jgi:predicted nucleic acid-binding protein